MRFFAVMRLRGSYCYQDAQYQDYQHQFDCFDKDSSNTIFFQLGIKCVFYVNLIRILVAAYAYSLTDI